MKKEGKISKFVYRILLVVCVCVFIYSAYNLVSIYLDYRSMDEANDEIIETYVQEPTKETNDYLQIDWAGLLARNSDVQAWIQIPDTNVNYVVLKGENNDTYIHSDIDKKYFRAGSIFVESSNQVPFNDLNTVVYGHNMKNGSMFANIKSYTEQEFANEHPYVYIYLPDGSVNIYKVVSAHIIKDDSELYNTSVTDIQDYYNKMLETSEINVDFDRTANQPVLTLSTCTSGGGDNGKRNVVHAVLQEKVTDPTNNKMLS